jgi:TP901-1 family phage major tail protein
MAIFNGTELGVYISDTLIAAAQSVSVSLSLDTIEITTNDSAGWSEFLAGKRGGTMQCDGLLDMVDASNKDVVDLWGAFENRTVLTLKWAKANPVTGEMALSASGILTSLELSSGSEDTATYSASFQLTGVIADTITA